ncbi:MAG TPA: acetyl-CoA carboxylase biotin carboxyl carrier protein subunit [Planctomycetota bacterium]
MKLLWRGKAYEVRVDGPRVTVTPEDGPPRAGTAGASAVVVVRDRNVVWVSVDGVPARFEIPTGAAARASADEIRSPMTGTLVDVRVKAGDAVRPGQVLAVVAAMKMEFRLEAPREGTVAEVFHPAGAKVELGSPLLRLKP